MWSATFRRSCVSSRAGRRPHRFPKRRPDRHHPRAAGFQTPSHPDALTPTTWNLACSSIAGRRASGFLQVSLSKVSRHWHRGARPATRAETPPITLTTRQESPLKMCGSSAGRFDSMCGSPFSINDLRNLIVVAIERMMWTDARHREVVAHGGTAQSATTICFRCLLHQVPSAAANGARGSLAPRLLAGPVQPRDALHSRRTA